MQVTDEAEMAVTMPFCDGEKNEDNGCCSGVLKVGFLGNSGSWLCLIGSFIWCNNLLPLLSHTFESQQAKEKTDLRKQIRKNKERIDDCPPRQCCGVESSLCSY